MNDKNSAPPPTPSSAAAEAGRGRFVNRGGNRHNNCGRRNNRNNNFRGNVATKGGFEGSEPSLKGHIYNYTGERNLDQFIKTTEQIRLYVGRTYNKFTTQFYGAVDDLHLEEPVRPVRPEGPADMYQLEDWRLDSRDYQSQVFEYANFKTGLYTIVLGQCTDTMKDKLKSHPEFTAACQNSILLLKLIKTILYSFEEANHDGDEKSILFIHPRK